MKTRPKYYTKKQNEITYLNGKKQKLDRILSLFAKCCLSHPQNQALSNCHFI